jgi:hypothetical protein
VGVEVVADEAGLRRWIELTDRLYAQTPQFIPPVQQQLRDLFEGKAPHLRHGQLELLALVRDGRVVGRTTAHTNAKLDAKLGASHLLFGFTEFENDPAVVDALFGALVERGRRLGAEQLFGPVNLLPNQSGGVVLDGYEERGFVDSPYNLPYYPAAYARHGFERAFEGATVILTLAGAADVDRALPFDDARIREEQLVIRQANRRRLASELDVVRTMLNDSFAQLGYYTEIEADELAYQVDGLRFLLDERIALYLLKAGRPIAFILCIPDISEFVRQVGGDLGILNQLRLLLSRRRYRREAICVIQGTVPDQQGKGYLRLLTRELVRNLQAGGYETLRGTFIEHENLGSSAHAQKLAGRPLHRVAFYTRHVE